MQNEKWGNKVDKAEEKMNIRNNYKWIWIPHEIGTLMEKYYSAK